MAAQEVGQDLQRRARLVVPVSRALHHLGVGAERGIVHERPVADDAEVDPLFHAVGEGVETGGRIVAVQPEVHREVVAGAGADHEEREVVLGGDPGHQRLCPVAPGHAEQVRAVRDRLPGQRRHIDDPRAVEQRDLGPQRLGLLLQPELRDLPAARPRVHDHERTLGRLDLTGGHAGDVGGRGQRPPGGADRQHHERDRHQRHPDEAVQGEHHQYGDRGGDHHSGRYPPEHPAAGEELVRAPQHQARTDRTDDHHGETGQLGEADQDRRGGNHQREGGPGEPASLHSLVPLVGGGPTTLYPYIARAAACSRSSITSEFLANDSRLMGYSIRRRTWAPAVRQSTRRG